MKFDKQLAIILVLLSMLLSAIAVSVYFYNQSQTALKSKNQLVTIYVAKDNIKRDTLITNDMIKQTTIARQFVLTKPLLKKEILNKFAKEAIYKNEAFLKEKLTTKVEEVKETKILDYKFNSYNMALNLFQNPNYSLKPNDIIKIISVYPEGEDKNTNNFSVQYVAKNIKVLGFLQDGYESDKSIIKKKIKRLVKKKQVEEIIDLKADEIILDVKQDILLSLIDDYNKGKQLWMVKSKLEKEDESFEEKEEEKKKLANQLKTNKKVRKKYVARSYPVKWYKPKSITSTKTAKISYADNSEVGETKSAKITFNYNKECSNTDKLLIVVSNKTQLRKKPSRRSKVHKTIYKNYILAYKSVSKINPNWYMICDGTYVNSENVTHITYEEYKKLK